MAWQQRSIARLEAAIQREPEYPRWLGLTRMQKAARIGPMPDL
jgi:hypothetical protein